MLDGEKAEGTEMAQGKIPTLEPKQKAKKMMKSQN
jgi:hypothetical protein